MSSLRLLAAPDHLPLFSLPRVSGRLDSIDRCQSHGGQTGAGASIIPRPRGQSQPIAGNSSVSVIVSCLQQSTTTSLSQSSSVKRVELAGNRRGSHLTSVELLRTYTKMNLRNMWLEMS